MCTFFTAGRFSTPANGHAGMCSSAANRHMATVFRFSPLEKGSAMVYASQRRRLVRRLSCEALETRLVLSGVGFVTQPPIAESDVLFPTAVYAVDVDGDRDVDILTASRYDDKIAWYENTDGQGSFAPENFAC